MEVVCLFHQSGLLDMQMRDDVLALFSIEVRVETHNIRTARKT